MPRPPPPPPGFPARRPGRAARLAVAAAAALAALLAGEVLLRAGLDTAAWRLRPPGLRQTFHPSPETMPGVAGPSRFEIDCLGFRGEEPDPAARYRILALGGSTVECLYLDQDEAWPALVQARLRAVAPALLPQVFNGGTSGRTTRDHAVQVPRLLAQHPEIDLVLLVPGVNDLALFLAQGPAYDPGFLARPGAEESLLPHAFARVPLSVPTGEPWWRRTGWWRLAALAKDRLAPPPRAQDESGAVYARWRVHRAGASDLRAALPDLAPLLDELRCNLAAIADRCTAAGRRLVLATHPAVWAPDLPPATRSLLWMGGVGPFQEEPGAAYYTPEALAAGLAAVNGAIAGLAAARNLECLDLAGALGADPALFYDDVHLNEAGARRAAEVVADFLLARPPFR
ncbi:MAG: GDSL-type esterase/lipase family protein [Planctomycetota bacterium]